MKRVVWNEDRHQRRLNARAKRNGYGVGYTRAYGRTIDEVRAGIRSSLSFLDYTRKGRLAATGLSFGNTYFTRGWGRTSLADWLNIHITIPMARLAVMDKRKYEAMNTSETKYLDLMQRVLTEGENHPNRTGTDSVSIFGEQIRYDLRDGFPLWTTKKMAWKLIVSELLWFLQGCPEDMAILKANNNHIWDANVAANGGKVGPIYGAQWRAWKTYTPIPCINDALDGTMHVRVGAIDQIAELIAKLKDNRNDRRMLVRAYNPSEIKDMCLPPCHGDFECYVSNDGWLDLKMSQRSVDDFLGAPFNVASYALLMMMLAQVSGLKPRYFIHDMGNVHIYADHQEQVLRQLAREPFPLPTVKLDPTITDIDDFTMDSFELIGYESHATIKAQMAV